MLDCAALSCIVPEARGEPMWKKWLFIYFLTFVLSGLKPAISASFECSKAVAVDERAICADSALSRGDDLVAATFIRAAEVLGKKAARAISKPLIAERRKCLDDRLCISLAQTKTVAALRSAIEYHGGSLPEDVSEENLQSQSNSTSQEASWRNMWDAAEHKPFDLILACYGHMTDLLRDRIKSKMEPNVFEAAFLAGGGNKRTSELAYQLCDPAVRRQKLFDDDTAYADAKRVFKSVALLMDLDMLTRCQTDQCREIAAKVLK